MARAAISGKEGEARVASGRREKRIRRRESVKEEMRKKKLEDDKGNFDFSSFRQYEESVLPIVLY